MSELEGERLTTRLCFTLWLQAIYSVIPPETFATEVERGRDVSIEIGQLRRLHFVSTVMPTETSESQAKLQSCEVG